MKKALLIFLFTALSACLAYADDLGNGEVLQNNINIRADSTVQAQTVCTVKKGAKLDIIEEKFDWYKVRLPQQFKGYVWAQYLEISNSVYGKVNANNLNIRLKPALDAYVVGSAQRGDKIRIIGKTGDWYKVRAYPYGWGWINKQFLRRRNVPHDLMLLVDALSEPNIAKKQKIQANLIARGPGALPALESYISPDRNQPTTYSLIRVISEIARNDKEAVAGFFAKIDENDKTISAVYLDILQNIVAPKEKLPYYYYALQKKLTTENILAAKDYLKATYNGK